ncbi:MAG: dienelactone hydrolase family protein [Nitrososphaerales archaeon]
MTHFEGVTGNIEAYLAKPDTSEPRPAVIVIHEIFGLVEHTKEVANRFASQEYVTLAPHLFSGDANLRSTLTPQNIGMTMQFMHSLPTNKMRDFSYIQEEIAKQSEEKRAILQKTSAVLFGGGLPKDKLTQDLVKAMDYLNSQSFVKKGKIACVGFCFGGGMSINLACHAEIAACVIFYGENPSPIGLVENIKGSVLGLYGGEDLRINSNLGDLVRAMAQYKKDFEMRIYPGAPHAFFNDTNKETFREQSAKDAWDRVLRFYERTLLS